MSAWDDLVAAHQSHGGVGRSLKIATLAQWMLESGRGSSVLAREHLNFGGLKYRARMAGHAEPVDYRGSDGELATYCKFSSAGAFIAGYWHFIDTGPYEGWREYQDDSAGYIRHISRKGYAADPAYVEKVLALFDEARHLVDGDTGEVVPVADTGLRLRLAVIVGHNRVAKGASAVSPIDRSEYDFNSKVAAEMKAVSAHYNIVTEIFFREPSPSYQKEIKDVYTKVADWGADCAIELHFNAAGAAATGSEVLFRKDSLDARALAHHVLDEIVGLVQLKDRGVKPVSKGDRGAGSLYALDPVPTVLVEPFFGSHKPDCLRVASLGEEALALAYLRGVRDWAVARVA